MTVLSWGMIRDDLFCSELEQILGLVPIAGDTLAKRQARIIKATCQLAALAGRLQAACQTAADHLHYLGGTERGRSAKTYAVLKQALENSQ